MTNTFAAGDMFGGKSQFEILNEENNPLEVLIIFTGQQYLNYLMYQFYKNNNSERFKIKFK